jgi:hypothetical protein
MLDQLPLELVRHIVRFTFPSSYSPLHYRQRQDTLLTICRTSKGLLQVAQPVLLEVVELTSSRTAKSFFDAVMFLRRGRMVKTLRFDVSVEEETHQRLAVKDVLAIVAFRCRNIEEVRIRGQDVDFCWLEAFPSATHFFCSPVTLLMTLSTDLRRVVLVEVLLYSSRHFFLPHLEALSAVGLDVNEGRVFAFSPRSCPSLRALHLEASNRFSLRALLPILPFLDSLSCGWSDINPHSTAMSNIVSSPNLLMIADFEDLRAAGAVLSSATHLRVNKYSSRLREMDCTPANITDAATALLVLGEQLRRSTFRNLSSIFLPLELDPSSFAYALTPSQQQDMTTFLSICTSFSIDVIFEESPHPYFDSLISAEFLRRSKKRREAEAAKQSGSRA